MATNPVVFGEAAAKRIAAAVKRVEAMPYFPSGGRGGGPRGASGGVVEARASSSIGQATATAYGTGSAVIQIDDGSGNFVDDPAYAAAVDVYNYSKTSGTIASGTHIMIAPRGANWRLVSRDC